MTRQTDVIRMLAAARPAQLEPEADPVRRERDLAAAFAHPRASDAHRRWRMPQWSDRPGVLAIGGAAVAVAAVMATILVSAAHPRPGSKTDAGPDYATTSSAPALLLAAAERTETADSTVGRYWLAERQTGILVRVGPANNQYTLLARGRDDNWMSTLSTDPTGIVNQHLDAVPATAADEAAWKRDGSPTEWNLGNVVGKPYVVTAAARTPISSVKAGSPGWSFVTGGRFLTVQQLLNLPAEPAALRETLLAYRPPTSDADDAAWLFDAGKQILMGLPVPPKVRGAAYRMLAELPGVRSLGPLDDPSGRRGQAIAITEQSRILGYSGTVEAVLIFDPATGTTLCTEIRLPHPHGSTAWAKPGTVWYYELLRGAGWTTKTPPPFSIGSGPADR